MSTSFNYDLGFAFFVNHGDVNHPPIDGTNLAAAREFILGWRQAKSLSRGDKLQYGETWGFDPEDTVEEHTESLEGLSVEELI